MRKTRRYLGLELAGAKNQKTALAVLEFYPKERKIFLLDIYDRVAAVESRDPELSGDYAEGVTTVGDQTLLELLGEMAEAHDLLAVNVPLELPPMITCARTACQKPTAATTAALKWMRDAHRKATRQARGGPRVTEYTTYTQRPVELWIRYQVLSEMPESHRFDVDETLGGNKAPLAARMHFIRRALGRSSRRGLAKLPLVEAWPKLTVSLLALELDIPKRVVQSYRRLEEGAQAREQILEQLARRRDVFIYERDIRKLAGSLPAFDAFVCAYTAYLADTGQCAPAPKGFPKASGWVQYPAG